MGTISVSYQNQNNLSKCITNHRNFGVELKMRGTITQSSFESKAKITTLHYIINVGVRLLIFEQNSTQHVLIPYHTFINFGKIFQSSLKNEQKPQFLIVSMENVHIIFINFSTLYYYSIPYNYLFELNFPPNMLIPYHTFIR